jgi:hypothetical protein
MVETNLEQKNVTSQGRLAEAERFIKQGNCAEGIKHALNLGDDSKLVITYGGSQHKILDNVSNKPVDKLTEAKALDILKAISTPPLAQEHSSTQEKLQLRIRTEKDGKLIDLVKQSRDGVVVLNSALAAQEKQEVANSAVPQIDSSAKEVSSRTGLQPSKEMASPSQDAKLILEKLQKIETALNYAIRNDKAPSREASWTSRNLKADINAAKQFVAKAPDRIIEASANTAKIATNFIGSTVNNTGRGLTWVSEQISKGAEGLAKASQTIQKSGNWVSRQIENTKANSVATAAYKAFNKGNERVDSNSFKVKDYIVTKANIRGEARYVLSDNKGNSIMAFSADEEGVKDVTLFNAYDYVDVKSAMRNEVARSTDSQIENRYDRSSHTIAHIARRSLEQQNGPTGKGETSTLRGRSYTFINEGGNLTIKAPGRGTILTQTSDGVISANNLSKEDIDKFNEAANKFEQSLSKESKELQTQGAER